MEDNVDHDWHGEVEVDQYGIEYNRYNAHRDRRFNPGGHYSWYTEDGRRRIMPPADMDDEDAYAVKIKIAAAAAVPTRSSNRKKGIKAWERDPNCNGELCIFKQKKIDMDGMKIGDHCYTAYNIAKWYKINPDKDPYRQEYSPEDREKLDHFIRMMMSGGRKTKRHHSMRKRHTMRKRRTMHKKRRVHKKSHKK
jgi:hypothetical protein